MPAFLRAVLSSAYADCEHAIQRFSAIPSKFSADGNKRASTVKPTSNPFSFNSYAFKPAPQPSAPHIPFDPAELTRRLERYLASLEPGSDAAPARPSTISRQASSSSVTAARHAASSGQQQSRNGANQPFLNPRTKSATASAHSPASPNTGTAASPSKKSSHAALNNGNTALLASSREVAESLPCATAPRSNEDLVMPEALRQEARRATRRSLALHASKGLNAPVAAGELARRLNALAGSGPVNSAGNNDPLLALKSSSPVMGNGNVKRSSSARANEKRVRAPGADLRKSSSMRLATLELEREKMRTKEAQGSRRSTRRSMPLLGADADQLWRVYVSTQRGTNTQAMAPERQQKSVRKSASARRARPTSTSELDVMRGNGGKILQKSRSTGCVEGSDSTQANGELSKSSDHVFGRRPDWSQRDEMEKFSSHHHPLHLHVPGLGRNSLTTEVRPSGDERGFASDGERKRMSRTPEMKTSHRQSVRVADVSKRASSTAATARRGPPQLPALLHIPSLHSSDEIITLQQAPSSSSPLSPTTIPSPSITLSPVDSSDTIPMHPGFGPTSSSTNPLVSMRTSSSPTLPPLRRSSSFEARIPQHLFYSSADGQLHGEQSPSHHSFPGKASGKAAVALAPLPEISPLPAPDRFSKKRPSMAPRQKSSSTTVTTTSAGQRSTSTTKTTATTYAATNKARGQREYGTVMSPVSASAPSSVPWPGPSQGRGARVMVGSGVARPGQLQPQQHQRGVVREKRSQSAMEMRGGDEYSNNGNSKTLGRRKSVAFVSTSYPASASAALPGRSVGPQGRETSSGGPTTGIQRSSTLPVKGKVGEEKDAEGHAAKNSTRLVFWRRDSGKAVDEAMLSGGEEHHVLRSPSRLAFWKKGK